MQRMKGCLTWVGGAAILLFIVFLCAGAPRFQAAFMEGYNQGMSTATPTAESLPVATLLPTPLPTEVATSAPQILTLPTATFTPAPPTATPDTAAADARATVTHYRGELTLMSSTLGDAMTTYGELMNQASMDPALIFSDDWKLSIAVEMARMRFQADRIRGWTPAPGYEAVNAKLIEMANVLDQALSAATAGIDNFDADQITYGAQLLGQVGTLTQEATQLLPPQ